MRIVVTMGEKMSCCTLCPRECRVDREAGEKGFCREGAVLRIARAALHMWEEPCISGTRGSGTVFFTGCNLACVYCQNYDISRSKKGTEITVDRLAEIFMELQQKGAHNINLVTPTHYVTRIIEALDIARARGLRIPIVYNTGGYEKVETISRLENYVDIWMPDMKYMSGGLSEKYSRARDYFTVASAALEEMVRQIEAKRSKAPGGDFDADGIMRRGIIVRHMTLPGNTADSKRILRYLHEKYGDRIHISIMSQYTPMPHITDNCMYPELARRVSADEYGRLTAFAERIGISEGFIQEGEAALESFIPAFDNQGV